MPIGVMDKDGKMLALAIQQGYVPPKCTLDGFLVMGLIQKGEDACFGCNEDRAVCGGRSKRLDRYKHREPQNVFPTMVWPEKRDLSILAGRRKE